MASNQLFNTSTLYILIALAEGDKHGYGIIQSVAELTDQNVRLGPGTLYGAIKRLLEAKLIEVSAVQVDYALDTERRKYYHLTASGREALSSEVAKLEAVSRHARHMLGDTVA